MTQVDEASVTTVPGMFDPGPADTQRSWSPLIIGGFALLVLGVAIGLAIAPSSSSDDEEAPVTRTGSEILVPGALLGAIDGTSRYDSDDDVDRYRYAWPGQILTAPEPSTGDAVAWQWETCDVPAEPSDEEDASEEPPPLECSSVEGATERRWESPPTNRVRLVRVIVTVDLDNRVRVQAVTTPIAAVPWPDDITPGDPPPEVVPDEPPPATD